MGYSAGVVHNKAKGTNKRFSALSELTEAAQSDSRQLLRLKITGISTNSFFYSSDSLTEERFVLLLTRSDWIIKWAADKQQS